MLRQRAIASALFCLFVLRQGLAKLLMLALAHKLASVSLCSISRLVAVFAQLLE